MNKSSLRRELGLLSAIMMGIGGTLSAGNFVILGYAARLSGTAIVMVVLLCGIISLLTMFSYSELGTAVPQAGSEYLFAKVAFGGFVAFITGWFEWLSNMFYAALSSLGVAYILSYLIPINIPLTAVLMVLIFTAINIRGVKGMGIAECAMTLGVIIILGVYVWSGWIHSLGLGEFKLYAPRGFFPWGMFGVTAFLFELYLGAEAIAVAQAEIKNPEKTIPRAMLVASLVLVALYTSIVYISVRVVPPEILGGETSPLAFVAEHTMGKLGALLVTITVAVAGLAAVNSSIMAQSRTLYALSRDGYFPRALSKIHGRFGTPHIAIVVSSIFTVALSATGVVNFVAYAVNLGFIVGFSFVHLSLIKLRTKRPHLKRPFKAPLFPLTPVVGIAVSLALLLFIDVGVLVLGAELSILALLAYYIRMIGYYRIRGAFGGISLGTGSCIVALSCLIKLGIITLPVMLSQSINTLFYVLIFVGAVYILSGLLNIISES